MCSCGGGGGGWERGVSAHTEVAVPDLDAAVLAAGGDELAVAAVGTAGGRDLLPLEGAGLEHRLVLLVVVHVPRAHRAAERERETERQTVRQRERETARVERQRQRDREKGKERETDIERETEVREQLPHGAKIDKFTRMKRHEKHVFLCSF